VEDRNAMLDGWVLPVLEVQRVRDMREKICLEDGGLGVFYDVEEGEEPVSVENGDLRYGFVHLIVF
jgi:hypothetical protein